MKVSRRRFLAISAVAAGAAALGLRDRDLHWQGVALGADASLTLSGGDPQKAQIALAAALDTIRRMERLFSLYDPASALSVLNRAGSLEAEPEFLRLMAIAGETHRLTGGLFDPTVQPLFARALAGHQPDPALYDRIGWHHVSINSSRISYERPGMAMTLNGIAQGFATDRVSETLAAHGFTATLVNVGEFKIGNRSASIGVAGTNGDLAGQLTLENAAVATSASNGFMLPGGGSHILHPQMASVALGWASATVVAPTAAMADALSTALILSPGEELARSLVSGPARTIVLQDTAGQTVTL